ncbi:APC family permease [Legionella maceachernii]|nr:APC family permease [Legionella maceachernii]
MGSSNEFVDFDTPDLLSGETKKPKRSNKGIIASAAGKVGGAIVGAAQAIGQFIKDHKYAIAITALAIVGGAALTAGIIFFWPAIVASAAAFTVALPTIGTVAPLAWLSTLSLPAAAAVLGAFAAVGTMIAGGVLYGTANLLQGTWNFLKHSANFFRGPTPSTEPATKEELKQIVKEEVKEIVKHQVQKKLDGAMEVVHQHINEEEQRLGVRVDHAAGFVVRALMQGAPRSQEPTARVFSMPTRGEQEQFDRRDGSTVDTMFGTFSNPHQSGQPGATVSHGNQDLLDTASTSDQPQLH